MTVQEIKVTPVRYSEHDPHTGEVIAHKVPPKVFALFHNGKGDHSLVQDDVAPEAPTAPAALASPLTVTPAPQGKRKHSK